MSRAKLASKLIKYPHVEDYQLAMVRLLSPDQPIQINPKARGVNPNSSDLVLFHYIQQEHDRKSIFLCRQHLLDLRNIYALLTDLLYKNIVKITKPKGANSDGMYVASPTHYLSSFSLRNSCLLSKPFLGRGDL
jgi:hypothetical protein